MQVEEHDQKVEVDEMEDDFEEVAKLQTVGVNVSDIKKLQSAGIHTVKAIWQSTMKELTAIKGMSEAKAQKVREAANKIQNFGFVSGSLVAEQRKKLIKISTGSKEFDKLLGGGIETMSITEVFGEFRTGKTQLCHTLAVVGQLPDEMNGGNGKVIYIDTEGTFRPERIVDVAERFEVGADQVLENITYARAYTSEHQMDLLVYVGAKMIEEHYSLIIVDSATALFRVDFHGRGQLAERQQKLAQFLSKLTKLAEEFNVAVLITNQVVSDPGGGAMFIADAKKPIGGHIMAHSSTTRLYLRKGRGEQRVCKIYDSPNLPESECIYQLSKGGITDPSD
mmetsp:Transcript_1313/g.2108  ORF Transcript_1313/g.2108 Transcript_1313/m.2108 type:complete len:337 (-) Transcript_1313:300-1310(-)